MTRKSHRKRPLPPQSQKIVVQWLLVGEGGRVGHLRPELIPSFQKKADFQNPLGLGLPQDNKDSKGFRACALRSDYPG